MSRIAPNPDDINYRYGFNGREMDHEIKGATGSLDYGMRIYDPRIGKFLSVDPILRSYPMLSPYQFASNSPIAAIDINGLEKSKFQQALDWITVWSKSFLEGLTGINVDDPIGSMFDVGLVPYFYKQRAGQTIEQNLKEANERIKREGLEGYLINRTSEIKDEAINDVKQGAIKIIKGDPKAIGKAMGFTASIVIPIAAEVKATAIERQAAGAKTINYEGLFDGAREVQIYDPKNPGRTITDIDLFEGYTLVEEKSATSGINLRTQVDMTQSWIDKHIVNKFKNLLEARNTALPKEYANAAIEFRFTEVGATPTFRAAVEKAVADLRKANPKVQIILTWQE